MIAPSDWRMVDFLSDVHLDAGEVATFNAWANHLNTTPANALFILGDLFEVWIGDDTQDPFHLQCMEVLRNNVRRIPVFFMCGNRDFLVGSHWLRSTGVQGMQDPCVLELAKQKVLLSHGDALCIDDIDYMAFRKQVRSSAWQEAFLAKPLSERQQIAKDLRAQSKARQQTQTDYVDVDANNARVWLQENDCKLLIHGHTHRPASHNLGNGLSRIVLSDWEALTKPPRLEVLRWTQDTQRFTRISVNN
ncbi:MAG: UDP-2,3-diacylglucosamine diphosphatase [Betaproteobacteria bacterium]|jgi:UDP-2,3-diacylglucosamine hydrolase|nr:UDP-2,3-diacylglucosamine diphosphatase [Betaproteobacteria bacterium]